MSLFGSIQLAGNTLQAAQIGLQVVGQNIANANTPGYVREETVYSPAPVQKFGKLILGLGVEVEGIVQKVDKFLQERLLSASADRAGAEIPEEAYQQLEAIIGELSDTDLSTALTAFFGSIQEVLNQPEDISIRNLAVLQGKTLASTVNNLVSRVRDLRGDINQRVVGLEGEINSLTKKIADLNIKISTVEAGASLGSDAGALRDVRQNAINRLAEILNVTAKEQPNGGVNVTVGGELIVFEGVASEVEVSLSSDRGLTVATINFVRTDAAIQATGGELAGLYEARDNVLGGFIDQVNELTTGLINEFNRVYSQGQGLTGYTSIRAEHSVDSLNAALDEAGLPFTPSNGTFDLLVLNKRSGSTSTSTIRVDLNGFEEDSSLSSIASAINAIDGVTANISSTNELIINSDSADIEFAFARDTSGLLASLGINTFFTGTTADSIGVSKTLLQDPSKFAASRNGIGEDSDLAVELVGFQDKSLISLNGLSLYSKYDQIIHGTTQGASVAKAVADGLRVFESTLEGNAQAVSGVNIDEEAIQMLTLQRMYQTSARYIQTLSELLDILVNL